jgi:hypothetical protein
MYRYHDSSFIKAPAFLRLSRVMPLCPPWSPQPSDGIERWARAPALLVTESISLWRRARCACSGAAYSKRPSPHEDHQLEIGTRKTAKTAVFWHMALRRRAESIIDIQGRHASSSAGRMGERGIDGSDRREELEELVGCVGLECFSKVLGSAGTPTLARLFPQPAPRFIRGRISACTLTA